MELQRRKEKEKRREEQEKYRGGSHTSRIKTNRKDEEADHLDPMDPASYSDVPRWVEIGLMENSVKIAHIRGYLKRMRAERIVNTQFL